MKLALSLLTVLLEGRLAIGSPVVIGEPELVVRQGGGPSGPPPSASNCIFKFAPGLIIIPIGIPPQPANPLGFCSEFIQSSTTVISTSSFTKTATVTQATTVPVTTTSTRLVTSVVTLTSLGTQTLTRTSITSKPKPTTPTTPPTISTTIITSTSKTSTTSAPSPTTTGALCPTPIADQTCGLAGWGYATNNIYSGSSVDSLACHQLCLSKTDCASFQVLADAADPLPQCNLYNVPAGGNNTIPGTGSPYVFYDRGCPNFSPSTCKVGRRDELATRVPTPWYFSGIPTETLSDICSCMVTKPLPTAIATQTVSRIVTSTTAVLVPTTQTFAVTTTAATLVTTVVTRITTVYATQTVTVGSFGMVARGA